MKNEERAYRPELSTSELVAAIRRLLEEQRLAERLLCRYLADLSDRVDARGFDVMGGFADIYHASRCLFGMGVRRTRERVRVGRALRRLPRIEEALLDGRLAYSRVREVTRVARPEDEAQWLALARELPMRVLERRVAEAGGSSGREARTSEPAGVTWTSPDTIEVRLHLRAETWALLQRAMEGARRAAEDDALLADAEALDAVARDALARQAAGESSAVRRTVVLYECRTCSRTELETGAGPIELGAGAAAAHGCGAEVRDLLTEGRIERRGGSVPAAVARAVRLRDRDRCRVPGCSRRRYVDVHHIDERSRGGVHARRNCILLCDTHHRMLHERRLVIAGDADGEIEVRDAAGQRLVDPLAPPDATQLGSGGGDGARLLAVMGGRGGWDADALCEATGLTFGAVGAGLLTLELAGRAERDAFGRYRRRPEDRR